MELFYLRLLTHGLHLWYGRNCFLSTAHSAADVDAIVAAVASSVRDMIGHGLFGDASAEAIANHLPAEPATAEPATAGPAKAGPAGAIPTLAAVQREVIEITGDLLACDG